MRIALSLCVLAGCDLVFTLDDPPAAPPDAPPDAPPSCDEVSDEDCDAIANADDRCPSDPDLSKDQDADGVDDACDPNQGSMDTLVLFDGLNDVTQWTAESGMWDPANGALAISGDGAIRLLTDLDKPTIRVVIDNLDVPEGASIGAFGDTGGTRTVCEVANIDGSLFLRSAGTNTMIVPISGSGTLRMSGGQLANFDTFCRARFDNGVAAQVQSPFFAIGINVDKLGLLSVGASGRFRSISAFETP